jgi:hypothetical protein
MYDAPAARWLATRLVNGPRCCGLNSAESGPRRKAQRTFAAADLIRASDRPPEPPAAWGYQAPRKEAELPRGGAWAQADPSAVEECLVPSVQAGRYPVQAREGPVWESPGEAVARPPQAARRVHVSRECARTPFHAPRAPFEQPRTLEAW